MNALLFTRGDAAQKLDRDKILGPVALHVTSPIAALVFPLSRGFKHMHR